MPDIAAQAIQYAREHGLYLFPVRPDKRPTTVHGFKDATTDPTALGRLFAYENRGMGVHPGRSGYVVVDIDVKDGAEGEEEWHDFGLDFDGPEVLTPSGGRHLWYRKPEGMTFDNTSLSPSIDIRSDNGYVILPDSFEYRWEVGGPYAVRQVCGRCNFDHPSFEEAPAFPQVLIDKLKEARSFTPGEVEDGAILAGSRYETLFRAGRKMRFQGVPEEGIVVALLEMNRQRCVPPHPAAYILNHIMPGVMNPGDVPINPETGATKPQILVRKPRSPRRLTSVTDVKGGDVVDWLWEPYVPYGFVTDLMGDGDVGKSWIALSIAADLAKAGATSLYYSVESGTVAQIAGRWRKLAGNTGGLYVPSEMVNDVDLPVSFYMNTPEGQQRVEDDVKETGAKLIIVDPGPTYVEGSSNAESVVRPYMEWLTGLASTYGLAVIVIRHVNKSTMSVSASMRGMGSVAWRNAARSGLFAGEYFPTGERLMIHHKANLSPEGKGPTLAYTLTKARGFEWVGESPLTEYNLLGPENYAVDTSEAEMLLADVLGDGKLHTVKDLELAGRNLGVSKKDIGIVLRKLDQHGTIMRDRGNGRDLIALKTDNQRAEDEGGEEE